MSKHALSFEANLSKLSPADWAAQIDSLAEDFGYCEELGREHMAAFLDAGPKLLVCFEAAPDIRKYQVDGLPFGFRFARQDGWSVLNIISAKESWFRDPAIYGYFDRLIDDGFFEDFDQVLFYGAHGGGYAAAAYSVASPGCRVLALRPQATLDPRITGFDPRFLEERRLDFNSRYGYAPDMIDGSMQTYVAFDPLQRLDAIHAALFTRQNVTPLRCPHLGIKLDVMFSAMGVHHELVHAAMDGTLTPKVFAKAMRARRGQKGFVRALFQKCIQSEHRQMATDICAYMLRRGEDNFFRSKLDALAGQGFTPTHPIKPRAQA